MTAPSIAWQGRVISVQPRIRLLRSFDERSHSDLGYWAHLAENLRCDCQHLKIER